MNLKRMLAAAITFASTLMLFASSAFAEGAAPAADANAWKGQLALAIGLGLGIAAFGGALGQGKAASAALEGIGRNPAAADKLFTPMLLSLALIESLVIYSLVISFLMYTKM